MIEVLFARRDDIVAQNPYIADNDPMLVFNFGYEAGQGEVGRFAKRIVRGTMPANHVGASNYLFAIEARPLGSHGNGSNQADFALGISSIKHLWNLPNSGAQAGEIGGIFVNVKNGGPSIAGSDASAYLFEVLTVGDSGYASGMEGGVVRTNLAVDTIIQQVSIQSCSIDGKSGTMNGSLVASVVGNLAYAFVAQTYDVATIATPFGYTTIAGGLRYGVFGDGSVGLYPIDGVDTHRILMKNVKDGSHTLGSFILSDFNDVTFFDVKSTGVLTTYNTVTMNAATGTILTLGGQATPTMAFSPSSGASTIAAMGQTANSFAFGSGGVRNMFILDLLTGVITLPTDRVLAFTSQTSAAAAATATFTNAPTAGNPIHYLKVTINGVNGAIPVLAG